MALAFVNSRPFVTASIIGATTMAQLDANAGSAKIKLAADLVARIDAVHTENPNPCP